MDARDVAFTGPKVLVTERFVHKRYFLFRDDVTRLAVARGHFFVAPVVEVAGQARGLADANMLALNGLSMTTHTVQRLSVRMFAQMSVVAELDPVIEQDKLFVFNYLFVTAYLLAGCVTELTVRLGALGTRDILNQLHHPLRLGCNNSGNARLGMAFDTRYVFVR